MFRLYEQLYETLPGRHQPVVPSEVRRTVTPGIKIDEAVFPPPLGHIEAQPPLMIFEGMGRFIGIFKCRNGRNIYKGREIGCARGGTIVSFKVRYPEGLD